MRPGNHGRVSQAARALSLSPRGARLDFLVRAPSTGALALGPAPRGPRTVGDSTSSPGRRSSSPRPALGRGRGRRRHGPQEARAARTNTDAGPLPGPGALRSHRALRAPSGEIPCKLCGSPTRHLGAPHLLLDQPRVLLAAPPARLVRAVASRPAGWGAEVRLVQEGLQGEAHLPDADGGEPGAAAPVTVRRLGRVDDAQADACVGRRRNLLCRRRAAVAPTQQGAPPSS